MCVCVCVFIVVVVTTYIYAFSLLLLLLLLLQLCFGRRRLLFVFSLLLSFCCRLPMGVVVGSLLAWLYIASSLPSASRLKKSMMLDVGADFAGLRREMVKQRTLRDSRVHCSFDWLAPACEKSAWKTMPACFHTTHGHQPRSVYSTRCAIMLYE